MYLWIILLSFNLFDSFGRVKAKFKYEPTWKSLDTRSLPKWFGNATIGILLNWGINSVHGLDNDWYWSHWKTSSKDRFPKREYLHTYYNKAGYPFQDFTREFNAEFYNATEWVKLFKNSGANYVLLSVKHHDGYSLWPSRYSNNWDSTSVGPFKDITGELSDAVSKLGGIHFGVYLALEEFLNPLYLSDKENKYTTHQYIDNKLIPQLKELVNNYKPEILYSHCCYNNPRSKYLKSKEFLAWLYNDSPVKDTVVVSNHWGEEIPLRNSVFCSQYVYFIKPSRCFQWLNHVQLNTKRRLQEYMNSASFKEYLTPHGLIRSIVRSVARGEIALIHILPRKDGTIPLIVEERLLQLGQWLSINGEAIYGVQKLQCFKHQSLPDIRFTHKNSTLYAFFFRWPKNNEIKLDCAGASDTSSVTLLGVDEILKIKTMLNRIYWLVILLFIKSSEPLEKRIPPTWYDEGKIGIMIHWGLYSVPSIVSEWFWYYWKVDPANNLEESRYIHYYMTKYYGANFAYTHFTSEFTARLFSAKEWARIIKLSGAKYVIMSCKHFDGYALWPSSYAYSWNSVDVGPHRDIIGELRDALREVDDVRFGVYYSLSEWFHPLYVADKNTNFRSQEFVTKKVIPELKELVTKYQPSLLWTTGDHEADSNYWKSLEFLTWLFEQSPVRNDIIINNRWGNNSVAELNGRIFFLDRLFTCPRQKYQKIIKLQKNSLGYVRRFRLNDYLTPHELIKKVVKTVALGGNAIINISPTKDGYILALAEERLEQLGQWLGTNGAGIYKSQQWAICRKDNVTKDVWYTSIGYTIYAFMFEWPSNNLLSLGCVRPTQKTEISLLGYLDNLKTLYDNVLKIELPDRSFIKSEFAWAVKFTEIY